MSADIRVGWNLAVPDNVDWQARYTGFDPEIILPPGFDESIAANHLLAFARYEDKINTFRGAGSHTDRINTLYLQLRVIEKGTLSNYLPGLIKRAWFNTNLLQYDRGG